MRPPRLITLLLASWLCLAAFGQQASPSDTDHYTGVDKRGDVGMGFSQETTTHHFLLLNDGGAIEVEDNDPSDSGSVAAVREHMAMIARMFSDGDFELPMFIHDTVPPGVDEMKRLKSEITYRAENTLNGAEVRISTQNSQALSAIHAFLRFQITDHRTNDPLEVQK